MAELIFHLGKNCTVILDQDELRNLLLKDPELFRKALSKGKALKRCERVARYEKSRVDFETEDIYGKRGDING